MKAPELIVVSGLPASGKTTVGRLVSQRLSLPLIDKDAILEAMFDSLGCRDRDERSRLSRASDEVLFTLAETSHAAVLVNWWNHDSAPTRLRDITSSPRRSLLPLPSRGCSGKVRGPQTPPGSP